MIGFRVRRGLVGVMHIQAIQGFYMARKDKGIEDDVEACISIDSTPIASNLQNPKP